MKKTLTLVILCLLISACNTGNTYQYKSQRNTPHEWQPIHTNR